MTQLIPGLSGEHCKLEPDWETQQDPPELKNMRSRDVTAQGSGLLPLPQRHRRKINEEAENLSIQLPDEKPAL